MSSISISSISSALCETDNIQGSYERSGVSWHLYGVRCWSFGT
jgi:hypothetical protein